MAFFVVFMMSNFKQPLPKYILKIWASKSFSFYCGANFYNFKTFSIEMHRGQRTFRSCTSQWRTFWNLKSTFFHPCIAHHYYKKYYIVRNWPLKLGEFCGYRTLPLNQIWVSTTYLYQIMSSCTILSKYFSAGNRLNKNKYLFESITSASVHPLLA